MPFKPFPVSADTHSGSLYRCYRISSYRSPASEVQGFVFKWTAFCLYLIWFFYCHHSTYRIPPTRDLEVVRFQNQQFQSSLPKLRLSLPNKNSYKLFWFVWGWRLRFAPQKHDSHLRLQGKCWLSPVCDTLGRAAKNRGGISSASHVLWFLVFSLSVFRDNK